MGLSCPGKLRKVRQEVRMPRPDRRKVVTGMWRRGASVLFTLCSKFVLSINGDVS
jgi:hypothetical protein